MDKPESQVEAGPALRWRVVDKNDLGHRHVIAAFVTRNDAREWVQQMGHERMQVVRAKEAQ